MLVQKKSSSDDSRAIASRGHATVRDDFSQFSTSSLEILQKDIPAAAQPAPN